MTSRASTRTLPSSGGGVIKRTVLPGGLRIVTEAMPGVRSASIGIWVGVGSRDESPSVAGASHFLEHLLFKGTRNRSALEIATAMDAVGGEFNAFTEKEHTCFYATVLDRELGLAVDMISDVVLNATIAAADVDVERTVVLEEIAMRDDDPSDLVHDEFSLAVFGDTPLGRPILGTEDSINTISRTQVNGYYSRRYRPSEMVVSVAGNIDHAEVVRLVRKAFDGRLDSTAQANGLRSDQSRHRAPAKPVHIVPDDTEQANIVLGSTGLSRFDDRRFVLGVLATAIGGGMSSRLFQQIREQRGLAYSTYSFTSSYAGDGMFGLYAGCQPGKADEVVSIMKSVLESVSADGIGADEVQRAKGQLSGGMVLGLEDSGSRMTRIGKAELTYGDVLGLDDLLALVDAVTAAQVNDLAAELTAQPSCLTVVGPFGEHDFDAAV
ncbi:M16 family metallopeptidase [Jatrophihabitans lederbergiae]|uniref:Pitrilysin family protein n=1 Tax=Jatrophihabitans lederbergiae TaxID=3075547 RepID=A0ABU2J9C5_9ACTN|nr:pitrilysin family protein [Jatrophihabitans sp. DSM 44399]MDT0261124.1 pitrilysin family protein [Jatrophihabitans sp. DSM 44399]